MSSRIHRRHIWLILLASLTLGLGFGLPTAAVPDNSLRVWFLEDDPQLKEYDKFHEQFGNDEVILLHVTDEDGIFSHGLLTKLRGLSEDLEALEGVHQVHSILSTRDAVSSQRGLAFKPAVPTPIPEGKEELQRVRDRVVASPLFRGRLISTDGKQAMLWVQMKSMSDFDNRRDVFVEEVRATVRGHLDAEQFAMGGLGVIYTALNKITQRDFGVFISLTYLLMFGVLWWIFRSFGFVLATIGVITIGTVFCLGAYGWAGKHMNMVTVLLPTLVIVLGIADAVHFPTAFVNELRLAPDDRVGALKAGLMKILVPCFMTTLTTMAGFLALSGAPMAAVRDLGIFAAIGVGAALLASVILMVIAFMALREDVKLPEFTIINGWLARIISVIEHRPWRVGLFSLILIALTGYGALHLKADTYTLGYLPDDHGVVLDHHEIVDTWGDYFPLEYTVRPVDGVAVDSPKLLNAMEGFVEEASRLNSIRNGLSLATVFRRSQQAFAPDSDLKQPFSGPLVSQLKILTGDPQRAYEWDQEQPAYRDNVFAPLMNREGTLGRMTLVGEMTSAQEAKAALNELDVIAQRHFADLAVVEPAGYPPLYVKIIDYVIASQAQGFYIALGLIFCLMLLWLRSFRLALISLVVNVFPVTIMFGVMFFLGQTLDIASATIAAIVLGVSIDDTIHFMAHWRKSEESNLSWSEAVAYTFEHAGRPAVITTLLLVAGFPILMLAQVKTVFYFGLLTTIAAIAALFADLFILPLLLRLFPARRDAYGGTV